MKERELRKHAVCDVCGKKIGASGLPMFWTLRIERHGLKADAICQQDGLAAFLGSTMLAEVMGPDEELTAPLMDPADLTICETCGTARQVVVAALAERASSNVPHQD